MFFSRINCSPIRLSLTSLGAFNSLKMNSKMFNLAGVLIVLSILFSISLAEEKKPVTKLRIGIKKRAPDCTIRATKGDELDMHYTGTLYDDGTEFDSSRPRNEPLTFNLGSGQVIKGWDQGLLGMCEGEVRRLVIPSDLAYGQTGSPPKIPPNAVLVFVVELVKIKRKNAEL